MAVCYLTFGVIKRTYLSGKWSQSNARAILEIAGIIIIGTLLHRVVSNYIAYPIELGRPVRVGFWQSVFLISSFVDCLFVTVIFASFNFLQYQSRASRREVQLRKEKLEAELHFLRAQINPHFLFNTLNNIYSLSIKKSDHTSGAILKLSKLMRFMVDEAREERVQLSQEIGLIEDYIDLERLRFTDRRLTLNYKKNITDNSLLIAPMILMSFIENAFKHGAGINDKHTLIDINISNIDNRLIFEISNTRCPGESTPEKKIGLKNAEHQLQMLYKSYYLNIVPLEDKFTVTLTIDLDSYDADQMHYN